MFELHLVACMVGLLICMDISPSLRFSSPKGCEEYIEQTAPLINFPIIMGQCKPVLTEGL